MTFLEWAHATEAKWRVLQAAGTPLRAGQFYMNELHEPRPLLYHQVTKSNLDPFYKEENFYKFMVFVQEHW